METCFLPKAQGSESSLPFCHLPPAALFKLLEQRSLASHEEEEKAVAAEMGCTSFAAEATAVVASTSATRAAKQVYCRDHGGGEEKHGGIWVWLP